VRGEARAAGVAFAVDGRLGRLTLLRASYHEYAYVPSSSSFANFESFSG
jgi:hypothetical protein